MGEAAGGGGGAGRGLWGSAEGSWGGSSLPQVLRGARRFQWTMSAGRQQGQCDGEDKVIPAPVTFTPALILLVSLGQLSEAWRPDTLQELTPSSTQDSSTARQAPTSGPSFALHSSLQDPHPHLL